MSNRWKWLLILPALFALRLAFGLWAPPVQPMEDEIQTALIGLKYYSTGAWPYYGNDVITPPDNLVLQTQDPGPLEAFLVALPLKLWPNPLAPILLVNLLSMGGFCLLGFYACKRLPSLPSWFVLPWILTAPWCVHYSTGLLNFSYTIALACLFFVAFLESLPSLGLGWIPRPWANAAMGFTLSAWIQLHRTWVLVLPLLAVSFFLQWKPSRKVHAPAFFLLGALPLSALLAPTLLQPDYRLFRDVSGFSFGFNSHNLKNFFTVLVQFFAMACFEMPRFIGLHTAERFQFLSGHWLLLPGAFLWYFGFLQVLLLVGFLFYARPTRPDWNPFRLLTAFLFLFTYASLLFTVKKPDINTFCEMLPLVMLYSLYVWERWWNRPWGRALLCFALACALVFQTALVFIRLPERSSFYLKYKNNLAQAITQRNYHLLGERRPGFLY